MTIGVANRPMIRKKEELANRLKGKISQEGVDTVWPGCELLDDVVDIRLRYGEAIQSHLESDLLNNLQRMRRRINGSIAPSDGC